MFKFKTLFIAAILALSLGTANAAEKFITVASTTAPAAPLRSESSSGLRACPSSPLVVRVGGVGRRGACVCDAELRSVLADRQPRGIWR